MRIWNPARQLYTVFVERNTPPNMVRKVTKRRRITIMVEEFQNREVVEEAANAGTDASVAPTDQEMANANQNGVFVSERNSANEVYGAAQINDNEIVFDDPSGKDGRWNPEGYKPPSNGPRFDPPNELPGDEYKHYAGRSGDIIFPPNGQPIRMSHDGDVDMGDREVTRTLPSLNGGSITLYEDGTIVTEDGEGGTTIKMDDGSTIRVGENGIRSMQIEDRDLSKEEGLVEETYNVIFWEGKDGKKVAIDVSDLGVKQQEPQSQQYPKPDSTVRPS